MTKERYFFKRKIFFFFTFIFLHQKVGLCYVRICVVADRQIINSMCLSHKQKCISVLNGIYFS